MNTWKVMVLLHIFNLPSTLYIWCVSKRVIICNLPLFTLSDAIRTTQTWVIARSFIIRIVRWSSRKPQVESLMSDRSLSKRVHGLLLMNHWFANQFIIREFAAYLRTAKQMSSCQFHAYSFVETRGTKFPFTFDHCLWLFSFHCWRKVGWAAKLMNPGNKNIISYAPAVFLEIKKSNFNMQNTFDYQQKASLRSLSFR